jgi:rfaE bifunctional protein kinase chain/domain/rfaE bifunctional protein nucleotidyltransferase chain/domain
MTTSHQDKILTPDELAEVREELREEGQTVVQCHGCFDIVHPGHIRYLQFARDQGDALVVTLTGDASIDKGPDRPYINENLRAENLAALEFVSYVAIDHHHWAGPILEKIKPDIYVKGKEYETKTDPRFAQEKELVEEYGGKVVFSSGDVVYSSTYIIEEFRDEFDLEQQKIQGFCQRHDIDHDGLESRLDAFADLDVLVLGDPVLDHYIQCEDKGVASESPMLSVSPVHEEWYVGAAGLLARQLNALGANSTLLTTLADGEESDRFTERLRDEEVGLETVDVDDRPTFVKSRYLVDDQKIFKVNQGRYSPVSTRATEELLERLDELLAEHDALVATDFGYGLFGPKMVQGIGDLARAHDKPYFVDASGSGTSNLLKFSDPRAATPTEDELRFAFGDKESGLSHLAVNYFDRTDADHLVLTLGKRGALLFYPPEEDGGERRSQTEYLPAFLKHPLDPVGAGDVFLSALLAANLAGAEGPEAMYLGTCLSAIHITRMGNDPVPQGTLRGYLGNRGELRS